MFKKKTVKNVNLTGKRVLLRVDYNVPDLKGDYRIKQSIPTIEYILKQKPNGLVLISHLGRPANNQDKQFSLRPATAHLSRLLDKKVWSVNDCIGEAVTKASSQLKPDGILMLENLRFYPEEEKNDRAFAEKIVKSTAAEVFVQDGFGVVHRAHASTDAITKLLPAVSGLLLEKEVETITQVIQKPLHPLVAIIGGAKIEDKIELLNKLIDLADCVAVGGAMANNFLKVQGLPIGQSLVDKAGLATANSVLIEAAQKSKKQPFRFLLPVDGVVSKSMDGRSRTRVVDLSSHTLSDLEAYPKLPARSAYTLGGDEAIYDIGPLSAARIAGALTFAQTVIWNGTLGMAEVAGIAGAHPPFAHGSRVVAEAIIGSNKQDPSRPYSLAGGGDTAAYLEEAGLVEDFDHVSTGGGAALELMAGRALPGVEALLDR